MPVYNGERFLAPAIESILGQTHQDLELVISDNASTDATVDICSRYAKSDPRIRLCRQVKNIGVTKNYNYVFRASRARYFKWASANDYCAPSLIGACKSVLDKKPEVVACYPRTNYIDDGGTVFQEADASLVITNPNPRSRFLLLLERMVLNNFFGGLFRSKALRQTRLEGTYLGSDLVLIAELALHGSFHEIPECLHSRRMSPGTATACRSHDEVCELYFPGKKATTGWQQLRRTLGYFGAVRRSPLSLAEKTRLSGYLLKRMYWWKRVHWTDFLRGAREYVS